MVERLLPGTLFGWFLTSVAGIQSTTVAGIVVFAVGIIVGLTCVLVMDLFTSRRSSSDYEQWVAAGRPERRRGARDGGA